jgi:hypothetical protein
MHDVDIHQRLGSLDIGEVLLIPDVRLAFDGAALVDAIGDVSSEVWPAAVPRRCRRRPWPAPGTCPRPGAS